MSSPAASTLADEKRRLRSLAIAARERAHASHGARAGDMLASHGLDFLGARPTSVSAFMSFGTEIDVLPLVQRLIDEGWLTAMPVIVAPRQPLDFRAWRPGDEMTPGVWNIPRPLDRAALIEPDVLLVPLLAFDAQGYRLGYGGGFYDRTLAKLRALKSVTAVGVAYAAQEIEEAPRGPFDQPLDWILTEAGARGPCA